MSKPIEYPGIYLQETPADGHPIAGVPTSITVFIGRAIQGPASNILAGYDSYPAPITICSFGDYQRIFGGLSHSFPMSYAVNDFFVNGGGQAVIMRLYQPDLDAPPSTGIASLSLAAPDSGSDISNVPILEAASPGAWGNSLFGMIDTDDITAQTAEPYKEYGQSQSDLFNLTIFLIKPDGQVNTERFECISLIGQNSPNRLDRVLAAQSALVLYAAAGPALPLSQTPADWLDGWANFKLPVNSKHPYASLPQGSGGGHGKPLSVMTYENALTPGSTALDQVDLFNLLCIPPDQWPIAGAPTPDLPASVWPIAASYCAKRRAMLLIDSPSRWAAAALTSDFTSILPSDLGVLGDSARNAAVYFPHVIAADPLQNEQPVTLPPCGIIAGIIATTDQQSGVWKAPAGVNAPLIGAVGLEVVLNDQQNGLLNPLGINCLRNFPIYGSVVWGARTLRGANLLADEYKYISVRRLALYIEESIYRGLKWVVFEPNDARLWSAIRASVNAFMTALMAPGAFYSYFVTCDQTTMTQSDLDEGRLIVVVGFAPVEPAKFIIIQIQLMAGGASAGACSS